MVCCNGRSRPFTKGGDRLNINQLGNAFLQGPYLASFAAVLIPLEEELLPSNLLQHLTDTQS